VSHRVGTEYQFQAAQVNALAWLERGFSDASAIDVSAIGGAQVYDDGVAAIHNDLAMGTRDGRIIELEIICRAPPD
jgi:hypothetical protein